MGLLIFITACVALVFYLEADAKGVSSWKWASLASIVYALTFITGSTIIKAILKLFGIAEGSYSVSLISILFSILCLYPLYFLNNRFLKKVESKKHN